MQTKTAYLAAICGVLVGCATGLESRHADIPAVAEYCRVAQQIVTRTAQPVDVRIHESFDAFVKSKAVIADADGAIPEIQQFHWLDTTGAVVGISCKLKSADHLNLVYGDDTAGPDGACQDMNRQVYRALRGAVREPAYPEVVFDANETVWNEEQPGMTGPDWLKPYVATAVDDDGRLQVRAKGFRVDFTDPRFAAVPVRFRGVHYCHFIAPEHLLAVVNGDAATGIVIGRAVDTSGYTPPAQ